MKISLNWLKDYISLDLDVEKVSEILTDIGLEVEGYEKFQSIKGGLEGVVVGKVLTCEKHPNADKLSKTTVSLGGENILPIVCGAPNVAAGQKVLVATEGTKLYSGDDEFVIKKTKIRGEESIGMICAEDELGLGTSHEGIMVLPNEIAEGTLAKNYFNIEDDYVFEIGLTPNRIDAASHIGVARDLAAFLSLQGNAPLQKPDVSSFNVDSSLPKFNVEVLNEELCPRFAGVAIKDVKIAESPEWLQNKLKAIGLKPINNVVDVTNFVLQELAQPLHAYDLAKVGGKIVVRTAAEKTKFTTLDGVERELNSNDLMICNAEKEMCIAGVFGGLGSGVTDATTDIFLESAYFNPVSIRKTAKRHALNTDASFRFERGIDPNVTIYALQRAALLIQELAGGKIASQVFDSNPKQVEPFKVEISISRIETLLGKKIGKETICNILKALEIETEKDAGDELIVLVPAYRVDVQRQEDIVEEVLRIYGYNNIEMPEGIRSSISYSEKIDDTKLKTIASDFLVANGWNEIMNNSITKDSYFDLLPDFDKNSLVYILNPLRNELNVMRASMLFSSLEVVAYNANRQNQDVQLFEFGRTYFKTSEGESVTEKYKESQILSLCVSGNYVQDSWNEKSKTADFFYIKSFVNLLFQKLGLPQVKAEMYSNGSVQGQVCRVGKTDVVVFGQVSEKIAKQLNIDKPVFYAEIYWDEILKFAQRKVQYQELSQFPEVKRDLSLLIDSSVSYEKIEQLAYQTEKKLLKSVTIFDIYEGKGVPEGKKSYAINFVLQDAQKTLVDKQIENIMNNLIKVYQKELNAELR